MSKLTDDLLRLATWVEGMEKLGGVPETVTMKSVWDIMREAALVLEWQSGTIERLERINTKTP
jgi:hypothetical protein